MIRGTVAWGAHLKPSVAQADGRFSLRAMSCQTMRSHRDRYGPRRNPSGGKPYETGVIRRNDNAWVRLQGGSWNPRLSKQRRQENYAELCRSKAGQCTSDMNLQQSMKFSKVEKRRRQGGGGKGWGGKMESFRDTEEGLLAEGCSNERESPKSQEDAKGGEEKAEEEVGGERSIKPDADRQWQNGYRREVQAGRQAENNIVGSVVNLVRSKQEGAAAGIVPDWVRRRDEPEDEHEEGRVAGEVARTIDDQGYGRLCRVDAGQKTGNFPTFPSHSRRCVLITAAWAEQTESLQINRCSCMEYK
ncbi:uncharacterized protein An13g00360 [Aspergillus niger]|uniref:Contig An13c0010, genomic contig n=2 Tax=Aspergillus niger TaxID=5061 RepID=A2R187_ASPNC|nr:uncharacterized protein An13g00360 [Aspergillus niger]CAK46437.1 unnamed protein product [Aspergillus niger]